MNKSIWKRLQRWFRQPWYPLVLSTYPVLYLLSANIGQVKLESGWRPLLASICLSAIFFFGARVVLRDWHRAAFLTAVFSYIFFEYGRIYTKLLDRFANINILPWALAGWAILLVIFLWLATRPRIKFALFTEMLNLFALGVVIFLGFQISLGLGPLSVHAVSAKNAPLQGLTLPSNPPDVYYFVLDMYTRSDLLMKAYGYDNSGFISELEARGFYVAQCSQSNYTRTELSVTSSLNLSFIQGLDPQFDDPTSTKRLHLWDALKHNAVRYNFEEMGYKTISFATGFAWSELDDTDVFYTPPPFSSGMTEFETLFLQTTLARTLQDFGWIDLDQITGQNFRDRHMLVFDSMKAVANIPEPKFVYVHLIMPHPPFVFGPDGEHTDPANFWNEQKRYPPDKFKIGYINQITFLNHKLLETIDTILAESTTPPIIILQGDHGPWAQPNPQHFFILNAYYLPGYKDQLYPQISPVNTFRVIFNNYFGGNYDMLPDVTYYSPVPKLYDFSEVRNPCKS